MSFSVRYDDNNQEIALTGAIMPHEASELGDLGVVFRNALASARGTVHVNVKQLRRLNNVGFRVISELMHGAYDHRRDLKIKVITSTVVGWSTRKFSLLSRVNPNLTVEPYDEQFYPGQQVLEDGGFIPVLRTQTKMTWRHERAILPRHGLKPAMAVADVCCGIGDFAVLLFKEFAPSRLVALDHARPSLDYARKVASEFGIDEVEYVYGDAAAMLLDDNQFDFVTCRHSLQIFNKPHLILRELFRICRPGGRVYITNEKNSHVLGEPRGESIQWTFSEVARLFADFQMDVELGPKSRRYMIDAGFEDVRLESFMVTNLDGDPQDFADMIQAWENVYAGDMAVQRGASAEYLERFHRGFQDLIEVAKHPKGYAGWPIWVASGRKPG
jgi:ubiquinone/menaquinone biosynthesis C-methylase UbiE